MSKNQFNFKKSVTRSFVLVIPLVAGSLLTPSSAYAAQYKNTVEPEVTVQEIATVNSQKYTTPADTTMPVLDRESYSATTAEEVEQKHAAEKAAEEARIKAEAEAAAKENAAEAAQRLKVTVASTGTGPVRFPLPYVNHVGDGFGARGGAHEGVDLLVDGGTPIFAAADGVVRISQESYGGYGVAVVIDSVVDGQNVSTTYGHMTYGSRVVQPGETVKAGQVIGLVGSTGRSTANHLHFEVRINGGLVDPSAWLNAHIQ